MMASIVLAGGNEIERELVPGSTFCSSGENFSPLINSQTGPAGSPENPNRPSPSVRVLRQVAPGLSQRNRVTSAPVTTLPSHLADAFSSWPRLILKIAFP